ncbi:MAG: hypothetical protein K2O40_03545 [Lachnospiraceae bacterium]|nr:hypothetical protein [Lachnospiraceae bacterium]
MRSDKEYKSKVMRAANKMHNAGGCGAADEYSEGYDDAISLALLILMEEIGFVIHDSNESDQYKWWQKTVLRYHKTSICRRKSQQVEDPFKIHERLSSQTMF